MITDEMKRKALDVLAGKVGGCPGLGLSAFCDDTKCECRDEIGAALEAVAPMIRNAAMEEARCVAKVAWLTMPHADIMDADHACGLCEYTSDQIEALKTQAGQVK